VTFGDYSRVIYSTYECLYFFDRSINSGDKIADRISYHETFCFLCVNIVLLHVKLMNLV